jgi:hypothetical protein
LPVLTELQTVFALTCVVGVSGTIITSLLLARLALATIVDNTIAIVVFSVTCFRRNGLDVGFAKSNSLVTRQFAWLARPFKSGVTIRAEIRDIIDLSIAIIVFVIADLDRRQDSTFARTPLAIVTTRLGAGFALASGFHLALLCHTRRTIPAIFVDLPITIVIDAVVAFFGERQHRVETSRVPLAIDALLCPCTTSAHVLCARQPIIATSRGPGCTGRRQVNRKRIHLLFR